MTTDALPLDALPDLAAGGAERWRLRLERRMTEAGLSSAADVDDAGDFAIGGFDDAFSRLRNADPAELRRWFIDRRGERARKLAAALEIRPAELAADLRLAAQPPAAPWHPAFPGVQPASVAIAPPLPAMLLEVPEVTAETALSDAVAAWSKRRAGPAGDAQPVILWLEGPQGSGRGTLARALAQNGLGPVVEQAPEEGWHSWLRLVQPPQIAVIDPLERTAAEGRWSSNQKLPDRIICRPGAWSAPHLARLVERLADAPGGLRGRALGAARRLVADWHDAPDLLGGVTSPTDLVELLGVLRDEPDRAGAPRAAALYGRWRAIRRRGGDALAPWDWPLLAAFWRCCWLEPAVSPWWRPTRRQAEQAMATALAVQAQGQTVDDQLSALARSGSNRPEKVERLRRTLASRGATATLDGLARAGELVVHGEWVQAADPESAVRWVARGLADRAGVSLDGHWSRLAEADWPSLAGELVRADWNVNQVITATRDAPDWARADVARGVVHAFDASDIDTPSRRQNTVLRAAWADALWTALTGLTQLKSGTGNLAHSAFRETATVLRGLSKRFAGALPRLEGPHFVRDLRARLSAPVRAMSAGWHYEIGAETTHHVITLASNPDLATADRVEAELDVALAELAPYQCATARVEALPGAGLEGEARLRGLLDHWVEGCGRSYVVRRDFIGKMPAAWWQAIAEQAEQGDADAIAFLTDTRRPPTRMLESSDSPHMLVVPLDIDDDALAERISAIGGHLRQMIRVPDPNATDWADHRHWAVVVAGPSPGRPVELRWPTDDERIAAEWQWQVPDALRRRWLAHAPSAPHFRERWNRHFDRMAGRFEEMTREAPRALVEVLIRRAVGLPSNRIEKEIVTHNGPGPALDPPALFTVLRWALEHRARWVLDAIVELPERWLADARLGGRPHALAVSFPRTREDRWRSGPDDLAWARGARRRLDAAALMTRWVALDDLAHAAALALCDDHGDRRALAQRWSRTDLDLSENWVRRNEFLSTTPRLLQVTWAAFEAALDDMPAETDVWISRQLASLSSLSLDTDGMWALANQVLVERDAWHEPVPFATWLRGHQARTRGAGCRLLYELAGHLPELGPEAQPTPPHLDEPRVAVAALAIGSLAEVGLAPDVALPPDAIAHWFASIVPEGHEYGSLDHALDALLARRRHAAARALLERGDRRPISKWFEEPRTSGVPWALVRGAILRSPDELGSWLSVVSLHDDFVRSELIEPAIAWDLPQLPGAWQRAAHATQRRLALKHPAHRQARTWLSVLFDEAWQAGAHREAALWAWLIHRHHVQDDPRTLQVVEHWALKDGDPFDRRVFRVSDRRLTGGAGVLVEMMDTWVADREWSQRDAAVRRLHGMGITRWPSAGWLTGASADPGDREANRLDWLHFGYHEGIGGTDLQRHIETWVRAIDATDVRDAAIEWDASDWSSIRPWALDWWLETVDDVGLRSRLTAMLADIDGQELDPVDARLGRAGVLLREWLERDPRTAVDWMIERCDTSFRTTELVGEEAWPWMLDHQEVGLDAMIDVIARHRLAAVDDIWGAWWSLTSTDRRRRWVLRHLAWRATWNGPDAARAGVRLRRWALERS